MTATDTSVREAAARAWSLIADHRAGRLPDEPGLPLGIALDHVTDSGCERDTALQALCDAACARLRAAMPRTGKPTDAGPCVEFVGELGLLQSAERYRLALVDGLMVPLIRNDQQWRERADWLAWADDARLAILWLRELAGADAQVQA
jgi:hypothetical protein